MKLNPILDKIRAAGGRITSARQAILEILSQSSVPLSAEALSTLLAKRKLLVNKTTIYREIEFLLTQGLLRSVPVDANFKYYELVTDEHHHHVVCTKCSKFVDVETEGIEEYLEKLEKKLAKKINFKSVRHSLEFFGECANCKKKK